MAKPIGSLESFRRGKTNENGIHGKMREMIFGPFGARKPQFYFWSFPSFAEIENQPENKIENRIIKLTKKLFSAASESCKQKEQTSFPHTQTLPANGVMTSAVPAACLLFRKF